MMADAVSRPEMLPTLIAQSFRFFTVVPQNPDPLPVPILPVTTRTLVAGNKPLAVMVTAIGLLVSH